MISKCRRVLPEGACIQPSSLCERERESVCVCVYVLGEGGKREHANFFFTVSFLNIYTVVFFTSVVLISFISCMHTLVGYHTMGEYCGKTPYFCTNREGTTLSFSGGIDHRSASS